jgi:UDP-3-O-[3-hydroxymyristoyl] glucosamine N-acyltransferase
MLITYGSTKPLCLIGVAKSVMTQEGLFYLENGYNDPDHIAGLVTVITPEEFLALDDKTVYQYCVVFTLDTVARTNIINILESQQLDCFSYVHHTSVIRNDIAITDVIGHGSFLCSFNTVMMGATIGKHCILETYCLISHYSTLADNVIIHSGTLIAGKTKIGSGCMFNFKAASLNALTICDGVEVGALSTVTKDISVSGRYMGSIARYVGPLIIFQDPGTTG